MNTNEYGYNDWRNYLQHNWGNSPKMKAAEKKYNAEYYQQHKAKILAAAKERAGNIAEGAKNVAKDAAKDWASKNGAVSKEYAERQKQRMDEYAKGKTKEQLKNDYEYISRQRNYKNQLDAYHKTPLGRIEGAAAAGRNAISAGRSAMDTARNRVNRAKSAFKPLSNEAKARMDARANEMKKSGKTLSISIGGKEAISVKKKKKKSGSLVDRAIDRAKETSKKVSRKAKDFRR